MNRVMEINDVDGCTILWMHLIPLNCTPEKNGLSGFIKVK